MRAWNHDDITSGNIAAHVPVTLHQNDVLRTGTRRCQSGAVAGTAAANNQNITFVVNGKLICFFQINFFHCDNTLSLY